jgi:Mg2+ and Co2+ transporter CorA
MNPKTSNDLFNKIRSQFSNIEIGDETGQPTADSSQAVFFDFEFKEDADTFGRVSVSLADGESMKVFYNRNLVDKIDEDSKDEWFAFLRELKDFAIEHQLRFDVRDITKNNLTKQDYENLADTNKTVNTDEMSEELNRITKLAGVEKAPVAEGLRGTSKSSFENLDKTRLIIRHKGKVDETVPGARSRQIQSLYIENSDGERFKYPLTHLAGARAMQRHVSNGGRPHDDFGQHIIQTSEDIAKLNSFSRYASNKDQLNDNASDMIEKTKMKLENLRTYVKNLSKQSHYDETVKSFKTAEDRVLDDETRNTYREKFTLKTLDDRVEEALPVIHRLMAEYDDEEDQMPKDKDVQPTVLPKDADPIKAEPEAQVDHGAVVQSFLTDPEAKLVLRKDPTADKMLKNTKFKDKSTMLGSILSDIASRMLSKTPEEDRIANFASRVADGIDQEGATSFKPGPDYNSNKKIAVQLAKRYIDDYKKMQSDPAYADAVRMDPAEYSPKKKRSGGVHGEGTEAFESWVDETIKPFTPTVEDEVKEENQLEGLTFEDIKPYVSMYTDKDGKKVNAVLDKDGKEVFKTHDAKAAMAYLSQNYDKLKKEDNAPDMVVRDPDDEAEDKEQEIAKDQEEAEKINTELDRIKHLANI